MFCNKCGKEIPDNSEFCPKCGIKLNEKTNKKVKTNREGITEKISAHKLLFIAIIFLVLIITTSVTVVFINFKNDNKTAQKTIENKENKVNNTYFERYLNILSGKEKFLFQEDFINVTETVLSELFSNMRMEKIEYAIFDIDNDNCEEMFTKLYYKDNTMPMILVFNIQDNNVYGILFTYRELEDIKEDGTFIGDGGAEHYRICKMKLDKFSVIKTEIASRDGFTFKIENKEVTEEEFNNYFNEFKSKKNLELTTYEIDINIEYNHGIEIGKMYSYDDTYVQNEMTFGNYWTMKLIDEKNAYVFFYTYNSGDGEASYGTYIIDGNQLSVTTDEFTYDFTILDDGTLKYDFTGYIFK